MILRLAVVVFSVFVVSSNCQYLPVSYGVLHGNTIRTKAGNDALTFLRIPYAKPPVGPLRYSKPQPIDTWLGDIEAGVYGAACPSNSSSTTSPQSVISEDCLHVNVFAGHTCVLAEPGTCSVLYYIHGGGWNFDTPRMFPADALVDNFASENIIVVTVGYRLGSFGFLDLGAANSTQELNVGLHDIIAGLEWVQKEIGSFGGDPHRVTIMGHSTGATTVSLLTMIPQAQHLFQGAIAMSGGLFTPSMNDLSGMNVDQSRLLAELAGCANETDFWTDEMQELVLECLRGKDGHDLLLLQRQLEDYNKAAFRGPTRDGELIPDLLSEMSQQRSALPYLVGTTAEEWGSLTLPKEKRAGNATEVLLERACKEAAVGFQNQEVVADACYHFYSNRGPEGASQLMSDVGSFAPAFADAANMRGRANSNPVYMYSFDYRKRDHHAQDLTYIMGVHPFPYDENDKAIARLYASYFANFVIYGSPSGKSQAKAAWRPLDRPVGFNYYSIQYDVNNTNKRPHNEPFYHYEPVHFWTMTAPAVDWGASLAANGGDLNDHPEPYFLSGSGFNNGAEDDQEGVHKQAPGAVEAQEEGTVVKEPKLTTGGWWETLFWVTLGVLILLLIGILIACVLRYCGHRPFFSHDDAERGHTRRISESIDGEDDHEESPLMSSDERKAPPPNYEATVIKETPGDTMPPEPRYSSVKLNGKAEPLPEKKKTPPPEEPAVETKPAEEEPAVETKPAEEEAPVEPEEEPPTAAAPTEDETPSAPAAEEEPVAEEEEEVTPEPTAEEPTKDETTTETAADTKPTE